MNKQTEVMKSDLSFFSHQLIIGKSFPQKDFLRESFQKNSPDGISYVFNSYYHQVTTSIIEERFYWIYSSYGKPLPRTTHVINIQDGERFNNPRTTEQIEPNNQLFAVYDTLAKNFYISNRLQKNFFIDFFEKYTEEEVFIKNHYKNIDEFLNEISSVEKIIFTGYDNIFSYEGDVTTSLKNIFGYAEPKEFFIEAKYGTKKENLIERIKNLYQKQKNCQLKKLVCIGKNEVGFEKIFNTDSFVDKYTISSDKDEQSLFCEDDVKRKILDKLRGVSV